MILTGEKTLRIHAGEKTLKCGVCGKTIGHRFNQTKSHLNRASDKKRISFCEMPVS